MEAFKSCCSCVYYANGGECTSDGCSNYGSYLMRIVDYEYDTEELKNSGKWHADPVDMTYGIYPTPQTTIELRLTEGVKS